MIYGCLQNEHYYGKQETKKEFLLTKLYKFKEKKCENFVYKNHTQVIIFKFKTIHNKF